MLVSEANEIIQCPEQPLTRSASSKEAYLSWLLYPIANKSNFNF